MQKPNICDKLVNGAVAGQLCLGERKRVSMNSTSQTRTSIMDPLRIAEKALAIGVYAALKGNNFREVIRIAANHSGDSDSTASIAGQLYGAWQGLREKPHDWIRRLNVFDDILQEAF